MNDPRGQTAVAFREQWLHSENSHYTPKIVVTFRERCSRDENTVLNALRERLHHPENTKIIREQSLHSENSGCIPRTTNTLRERPADLAVVWIADSDPQP